MRSIRAGAWVAAPILLALSAGGFLAVPERSRAPDGGRPFAIALTGDSIVTRPLSGHSEPDYLALLSLLRGADAAFTNLETLFHDWEGPAMPSKPALRSAPSLARDLSWAGFRLVSRANNHAWDYGAPGMRATTRHAAEAGLVQAGVGESLAEARRAHFLRTPEGTVALLSAASTFPEAARAGDPRGPIPARPGIDPLRFQTSYTVTRPELSQLRAIARRLGMEPPAEGDALDFGGLHLVAGEKPGVSTAPDPGDLEAIAAEVRRASREADHVLVSIHCHEGGPGRQTPPRFLIEFAHAMIDAGADIVVGHGPHVLRGIEIYKGRPVFYSLGNFLFEYETVTEISADDYQSVGLPPEAKPDDFFDRYDQGGKRGYPADAEVWESAVAVTRWRGKTLEALEIHPITLGFGLPRRKRGRPQLAGEQLSRKILERLARLSEPFGTKIAVGDRVGVVVLTAGR